MIWLSTTKICGAHHEYNYYSLNILHSSLFLGVTNKDVPAALMETVKQTQMPLRETVPQFQELEFAFRHATNPNHHTGSGFHKY